MRLLASLFLAAAVSLNAADPALLSLLPPEAKTVAGMNVDRVTASPFGQFLLRQMQNEEGGLKKFIGLTGFDPRRDLREIVVAGSHGATKGPGLVVTRGTFDVGRILAQAAAAQALTGKYQGVDVLQGKNSRSPWIAFLDNTLAVAGDEKYVKAAIDRRGGGPGLNPRLLVKVNDVSTRFDAWFVTEGPISEAAPHHPDERVNGVVQSMQAIEQSSGGVRFGSQIEFSGEAVTRSDKDALALVDVFKFLSGMLQLNRNRPEVFALSGLLDTLELKSEANIMRISLSISEAKLEELIKSAERKPRKSA